MVKQLTYEEKFKRFKEKIKSKAIGYFFERYNEMKEIEIGLLEEKKALFNDKAKEVKDGF